MRTTTNRRTFLAASVAAALPLRAAVPRLQFPANPHDRLAVSSYPFRSVITPGENGTAASGTRMTLIQFAQALPTRLQISRIEPWSRHFQSTDPRYIESLHRAFESAGIRVVNIPVDFPVTFCNPDLAARKANRDLYRKWIDIAVALKSPSIRLHMPPLQADAANKNCAADNLKLLAAYGASHNIVVNLENDNPHDEDAFRITKAIERVNSPYLRALPDFCNSMLAGDEAYNYRAVAAMFTHAFNISHVKDMEDDNGKIYRVDLARTFAIAKKANYRGYFSMEWEGTGDPYEGTKHLLDESIRNLS